MKIGYFITACNEYEELKSDLGDDYEKFLKK